MPPSRFQAQELQTEDSNVITVNLKGTPFTFIVEQDPSSFDQFRYKYTEFKPNWPNSGWKGTRTHDSNSHWDLPRYNIPNSQIESVLDSFRTWLDQVVNRYLKERVLPDLWSQVGIYELIEINHFFLANDTSKFSKEERKQIRIALQEFKRLVSENFQTSKAQDRRISDQLEYLSEAVNRLNRFDWRGIAISTVIAIAIQLSLDTEKGKLLFQLLQQAFSAALRLVGSGN